MKCTLKYLNETIEQGFDNLNNKQEFNFTNETTIRDLLEFLILQTDYKDYYTDDDLLGYFSFVLNGEEIKGVLDFNLLEFFNLNNFNLGEIIIKIIGAYGIGGGFEFEELAKIRINADEPHFEPHVHIYPIRKKSPCYRISLTTFTQMKNDGESFDDFLNKKERKIIIEFLQKYSNEMIDIYNKNKRGILVEEDYIFCYNNHKYSFSKERIY